MERPLKRSINWIAGKIDFVRQFESRDWKVALGCVSFASTLLGGSLYGFISEPTNYPVIGGENCPTKEEMEVRMRSFPNWSLAEVATASGVGVNIIVQRSDLVPQALVLKAELEKYSADTRPSLAYDPGFPISRDMSFVIDRGGRCRVNYILN